MTAVVLVHHDDYADWVFDSHHLTQGRRFSKARESLLEFAHEAGIDVIEIASDLLPDRAALERDHDPTYVAQVMSHLSGDSSLRSLDSGFPRTRPTRNELTMNATVKQTASGSSTRSSP